MSESGYRAAASELKKFGRLTHYHTSLALYIDTDPLLLLFISLTVKYYECVNALIITILTVR